MVHEVQQSSHITFLHSSQIEHRVVMWRLPWQKNIVFFSRNFCWIAIGTWSSLWTRDYKPQGWLDGPWTSRRRKPARRHGSPWGLFHGRKDGKMVRMTMMMVMIRMVMLMMMSRRASGEHWLKSNLSLLRSRWALTMLSWKSFHFRQNLSSSVILRFFLWVLESEKS